MEKEQIKEKINEISEVKKIVNTLAEQFKAYFSTNKPEAEKPAEPTEPAKEAKPEVKAEFDFAGEFKKITDKLTETSTSIEGKFKAYDEKFVTIEAELATAKETIGKQDALLKKTAELIETLPTAFSTQKSKDKTVTPVPAKFGLDVWNS